MFSKLIKKATNLTHTQLYKNTEFHNNFIKNFKRRGKINRLFITGINGQIGQELYPFLRDIYGEENILSSDVGHAKLPFKNYEQLDVTDTEKAQKLIRQWKPDQILHFAAILSASGEKNIKLCQDVNIKGFMNVLETALEVKAGFFSPSTIAAFGPTTPKLGTPNNTIMRPTTVYGVSKIHNELMGTYYKRRYQVDFKSIRYPQVISPALPGGGSGDYAIEVFYDALKPEKKYQCYLNEHSRIPMIYIDDLIQGTLQFIESDEEQNSECVYNIEGCNFSPREITACLRQFIPDFEISYKVDFRQAIVDTWPEFLDDTLARQDWGWNPTYDIVKTTKTMLKLLRDQGYGEKDNKQQSKSDDTQKDIPLQQTANRV